MREYTHVCICMYICDGRVYVGGQNVCVCVCDI